MLQVGIRRRCNFYLVETNIYCGNEYVFCSVTLVAFNLNINPGEILIIEFTSELFLLKSVVNSRECAFLFPQTFLVG